MTIDRLEISNLPIFDVAILFAASKNSEYRSRALMRAEATARVFTDSGIANQNLVERYKAKPESFRVIIGDLSDEGVEFTKVHYDRWLANSDRWKGNFTLEKCMQTLQQQWEKFRSIQP